MNLQRARTLLRDYCRPVNYLQLIRELADEQKIPRSAIQTLIDSGEYGVGKYRGVWMIRKSKLYVPKIPKDKKGIAWSDLLAAVDAAQVFGNELNADVKETKWQSLLCPFHEEKNPSFRILLPDGGYHCQGCGESGGNVIAFIMALHHHSFPDAIRYLATNYTNLGDNT